MLQSQGQPSCRISSGKSSPLSRIQFNACWIRVSKRLTPSDPGIQVWTAQGKVINQKSNSPSKHKYMYVCRAIQFLQVGSGAGYAWAWDFRQSSSDCTTMRMILYSFHWQCWFKIQVNNCLSCVTCAFSAWQEVWSRTNTPSGRISTRL